VDLGCLGIEPHINPNLNMCFLWLCFGAAFVLRVFFLIKFCLFYMHQKVSLFALNVTMCFNYLLVLIIMHTFAPCKTTKR